MLAITLEPKPQFNLFPNHSSNDSSFEMEVVQGEQYSEIHLYFLTEKKEKNSRRRKKKSNPQNETIFLF